MPFNVFILPACFRAEPVRIVFTIPACFRGAAVR